MLTSPYEPEDSEDTKEQKVHVKSIVKSCRNMDPSKSSPPDYAPQQYAQGGQLIPQAQYAHGPYPGQVPVTVQPMVYVSPTPLARPMPDYMCYSIFTMLCCCLPLGIVALVNSVSTRNANISGQQQMAEQSSRTARNCNHAALGIGLTFLVLYIVYIFVLQDHLEKHRHN